MRRFTASCCAVLLYLQALAVPADTVQGRCDVYPRGEDHTDNSAPCVFSQRQGFVTIRRGDGVVHELRPLESGPGNFVDASGRPVYRQSGLGRDGLIFRFPNESVYVYWRVAEADAPATAPYSTDDYDATTLLRCRGDGSEAVESCPAGILRMEDGASIVVTAVNGDELTINFVADYVNTAYGPSEAVLEADLWTVRVTGAGVFEVPLAAIEGG